MSESYYIGVDVGTGSVRAALISSKGQIKKVSVKNIKTWNPLKDHYEQSSEDIWSSCKTVIKDVSQNHVSKIRGIGFDATCSLVVLDKNGQPLTVSTSGDANQNVILWMDHRASVEAEKINFTKHFVLKNVGGKVSLEMQMPKLMWLKKNFEKTWREAGYLFDLPDFLTWKATGVDTRSLCSLVCKWTYESNPDGENGWNEEFLMKIGLEDLLEDDTRKIGENVLAPGVLCGVLKQDLADELGLSRIAVATSIIDAHAGALGMLGCQAETIDPDFQTRLGLICGTSTCHMIVQESSKFVEGVWGPYYEALISKMWLSEAGQSATGALLDHIVQSHPAYAPIKNKIGDQEKVYAYLNTVLKKLASKKNLSNVCFLTYRIHIWPDFHGNRSPIADSNLKGMITGLTLANDEDDLAVLYLATIQALCYGTQHIITKLHDASVGPIKTLLMCGGLSKNDLFVRTQSDVCGLPVLLPVEQESVLVGAAILAASAAEDLTVREVVSKMGGKAEVVKPNLSVRRFHENKYKVFLEMLKDQYKYDEIMNAV